MDFIEPCFGIGHNLSLICQMTSEDIKHQLIIIIFRFIELGGGGGVIHRESYRLAYHQNNRWQRYCPACCFNRCEKTATMMLCPQTNKKQKPVENSSSNKTTHLSTRTQHPLPVHTIPGLCFKDGSVRLNTALAIASDNIDTHTHTHTHIGPRSPPPFPPPATAPLAAGHPHPGSY